MTVDILIVLALLAAAITLFVTEWLRHDVTALLVMVALGLTGVLQIDELLKGFSNRAVITIACMFVLSSALIRTGLVSILGAKLADYSKGHPRRFLALVLVLVCFMSAFINNTPVVIVFIPAVLTVCTRLRLSPSKFLMPISFASMLGGSSTLIGTSSNILVSALAEDAGLRPLGMFEFSVVGLAIVGLGLLYLLAFSLKFLPERVNITSTMPSDSTREYVTQVKISVGSPLVGKTLKDLPFEKYGVSVLELIRHNRLRRLDADISLKRGDILLIRGELNDILELDRDHTITIHSDFVQKESDIKRVEMTLVELMINPESNLIGRTCRHLNLYDDFGASVFALQRKGRHLQREIADIPLDTGDILLVQAPVDSLARLRKSSGFILLEGVHEEVVEKRKGPIALLVIAFIVGLAALNIFPISVLSMAGVAAVILTRLISPREAYTSIDWSVLVLIAGMISLGSAMGKTGALEIVASQLLEATGQLGNYGTLWVFYFLTMTLSLLIMNKPAAALATPLAIVIAMKLGVNPMPFIMAVAFAASTAMATPMGYQTNLLVYGPGGYNFKDFVKFGLPLNLLVGVVACWLIPMIWGFG